MAITGVCHVESAMGSGAVSVVAIRQQMGESRGIHRRKWSRIVAVIVVCQGVVELRETLRREWSSAVTVTAACQGVMELRRVRRRKWSSVVRYCDLPGGSRLVGRSSVGVGGEVRHL